MGILFLHVLRGIEVVPVLGLRFTWHHLISTRDVRVGEMGKNDHPVAKIWKITSARLHALRGARCYLWTPTPRHSDHPDEQRQQRRSRFRHRQGIDNAA